MCAMRPHRGVPNTTLRRVVITKLGSMNLAVVLFVAVATAAAAPQQRASSMPKSVLRAIELDDAESVSDAMRRAQLNVDDLMLMAARDGAPSCLKVALQEGSVDHQRDDGVSALMFASQNGHDVCVRLLLEAGARPHSPGH